MPQDIPENTDVLVIGGGNAGLCAAITAREGGAEVFLAEHAPKNMRGGNSRHTRNCRVAHDEASGFLTGPYTEEEYWQDLLRVTGGETNEQLSRFLLNRSQDLPAWMEDHGVTFQKALGGTLSLSHSNAFFMGGGKALVNAFYATAERLGVGTSYNTEVIDLDFTDGTFTSATLIVDGQEKKINAKAVVVAAGGFQADLDWLKEYWGPPADNFIVRGTGFNKGKLLRVLLDAGARPVSDPTQGHCVAIDARSPKYDGGIVTRLDCVAFGIVVDKNCDRFYDEGEDFWPKRYAIWGRLVAKQPDQIGYSIIDSKSIDLFMPSVFPPVTGDTIEELAENLEIDPAALRKTVDTYNAAVKPGDFDTTVLDGCATEGLSPNKTNWARPIDKPPFYGYPLRPGITFTYLGVTVNERAQVIWEKQGAADNVFAAGEVMAGNILGQGYLGGLGMTIGAVFGQIAGREAANYAKR
ncbi:MAG: FAD-dependent tricarballylate dehydrogenase TcuA [Rhodospirillales bacterium]|nr:FAD-dependent tricarballylate dehydrogenase TcuA [Rhodospirillales bacterium]